MKQTLLTLCIIGNALMASAQETSHFIQEEAYRKKVAEAFETKESLVGSRYTSGLRLLDNPQEVEALQFLYAYMPLADVTDYSLDFFLDNVRSSLETRRLMPWGKDVPDLLFRHFVLPVRVNDEALDNSRMVFFGQLRERVAGMGMKEAILEVNHWCHERVTYAPSDGRTLSPLACVTNALGRCGEESTFTVAALRSIGIPARQVYTPRWAHTDDNHAWVEAWADGKWYFLGACEPEPVLNLGWFNAPASRAMLMHTRAFGDYEGPEEVMLRTANFTEINLIDNYGSSARADIEVVDSNGHGVDGARIDFKIYNYAEFCTVATKYADSDGHSFLTAGKGDMLVWASKDGRFGYSKVSFGTDKTVRIVLSHNVSNDDKDWDSAGGAIDIVPPDEHPLVAEVSEAQKRENQLRLAYEDSLRRAYEQTFYQGDDPLLRKARGNWRTINDFRIRHADQPERVEALLASLSDKDLRDMPADILDDNLTAPTSQLCPRVENEMIIHPFKHYLRTAFEHAINDSPHSLTDFQHEPSLLVEWIKSHIQIDWRTLRVAQTPVGVWQSKLTDTRSRDIFFVDLARSLDIEARKDEVTGKVQYRVEGEEVWIDVQFESQNQTATAKGTLRLTYTPTPLLDNPKYYSHFTLSRITPNGVTSLLNFAEEQVDMGGGTSWSNTFKDGIQLDEGLYLLTTGTRLAKGGVLAQNRFFTIRKGAITEMPLEVRQADGQVSVIGTFDAESTYQPLQLNDNEGKSGVPFEKGSHPCSVLSQTGRGYYVAGLVGMGQEPTNHALRDIAKIAPSFNRWGRPLLLLFENEEEALKWNMSDYGQLPQNILFGIDTGGSIRRQIASQMKLKGNGQLPLFIIADSFNRVVFVSEGYTIGLGDQLLSTVKGITE